MKINPLLVVASLAIGLAGCRSSAPHYYLMTPQPSQATATSQIAIGIGPVIFPEHLNRTQLLRRLSTGQVKLLDKHRWAEPLQANFTSTVAENLAGLVGTERIMIYPYQGGGEAELDLYVRVLRFEFDEKGAVVLSAVWSLTDSAGKLQVLRHETYKAQAKGTKPPAIVAAMAQATAALSRDVASHIAKAPAPAPPPT